MKSVLYDPIQHKEMLISWYEQWSMPCDELDMLPDSGLIIPKVCAVFLYKTNSSVCMIESLICNKDCNEEDRKAGLDVICNDILDLAKDCGFKKIISLVNNPKVIERISKLDYTISKDKFHIMIRSFK